MVSQPSWQWRKAACPCASNTSPLKEPIDRHDAAAQSIGLPEHWKARDTLSFGVDGPATAAGGCAPMWDQAPLDQVKRAPARLVVLPDDQQRLARRNVVARANSSHAAVADIEAFDNRRAEWSRTLDYAATQTGIGPIRSR